MEKMDQFTAFLVSTELYAELNKQYTSFEVFEVNNGVFEIAEVQTAYQRYLKETSIHQKRGQFSKNLNSLIDGKHVVIPNELSWEDAQQLSGDPNFFEYWQAACTGDSGEDCACLAIKAVHQALINKFQGSIS